MIQTIDLSKNFDHVAAVKAVNFSVNAGESSAFSGPTARERPRPSAC
jgi:ABC-type multidrug transport system ATPase subunit